MTTIALVLVVWAVLSLPLAYVVGRLLARAPRPRGLDLPEDHAPV